jgi:hypothetical protein
VNEARKAYREFVAAGVDQGRRDDLVGGGLRRSLKRIGPTRKRVDYDERVLGGSEFVSPLRREESLRERLQPAVSLAAVVDRVGEHYGLTAADVRRKSRAPAIVEARGLVCYVAVRKLGYQTSETARLLHMTPAGVSMAVHRGAKAADHKFLEQLLEG